MPKHEPPRGKREPMVRRGIKPDFANKIQPKEWMPNN
jgi:hypothetical protein